jgi:tetratricopeptide (TPR) repeat protein
MTERKESSLAPWVVTGIVLAVVALYSVYKMSGVHEIIFKYQELELKVVAAEIKEAEQRYQESFKTRPEAHLASVISGVETGMAAKESVLSTEMYLAEAILATTDKVLAQRILDPRPLADRVRNYAKERSDGFALLRRIADGIEEQRRLVDRLKLSHVVAALKLTKDVATDREGATILARLIGNIASDRALSGNGSAYNFLGNLAFALRQPELAYRYLYQAYVNDPEHLPTLDSLSFALWKFNGDCQSSLTYAVQGYQKGWKHLNAFKSREKEILGLLGSVKSVWPPLGSMVDIRSAELADYFSKHGKDIVIHLTGQYDSLRNMAVYCMAFEHVQEVEARRIADELLNSDPNDSDYMDTKGFVLMRFQKNQGEIEQAAELFDKARHAARDSHQRELAEHHLSLVGKLGAARARTSDGGAKK